MELADLLALEQKLRREGTTTETLLGYCLYLNGKEVVALGQRFQTEFDISDRQASDLIEWLEYLGVARLDERNNISFQSDRLRELLTRVEWLFDEHSLDQLSRATVENPDQVRPILNVPEETDFDVDSTIIGSLIDLLATAEDSAVVMNPFYTQVGFDLLQEALVGVPKRGASLTLMTRDVLQGTGENRNYVRQLVEQLESVGRSHHLSVYEFNSELHNTATFHAKAVIVDRQQAYIGSANMTERSLRNAIEMGTIIEGKSVPPLADTVEQMLTSDLWLGVDLDDV
ncbi:PLD-like domain-containing protein [Halomicrobium zhouii]|uniref:PLD-like domain-containing protein n=1 Tax=Halomicrobium zhouii TaxID=767519 RepID=A0A1I6L1U6_9EURY|nr:phospholipase D-like domain-containing protein [Halomicrobium zhouii]SFR97421.1 PLD-like domain-containing protein [Halomicrobium zhouii]